MQYTGQRQQVCGASTDCGCQPLRRSTQVGDDVDHRQQRAHAGQRPAQGGDVAHAEEQPGEDESDAAHPLRNPHRPGPALRRSRHFVLLVSCRHQSVDDHRGGLQVEDRRRRHPVGVASPRAATSARVRPSPMAAMSLGAVGCGRRGSRAAKRVVIGVCDWSHCLRHPVPKQWRGCVGFHGIRRRSLSGWSFPLREAGG